MHRVQLRPDLARAAPVASGGSPELKAESVSPSPATQVLPGQLGRLERSIIDLALRLGALGLRRLRPSLIAPLLGADVRRVHDALRRLEARGLVRRVARGQYELSDLGLSLGFALPARKTVNETTSASGRPPWLYPWLGRLERLVLSYIHNRGLNRGVPLHELAKALKVDVRRVWWALRRLEARGYVRRVGRGWYELAVDPNWLAKLPVRPADPGMPRLPKENSNESPKAAHGTRGPARDPPILLQPDPPAVPPLGQPTLLPAVPVGPCAPLQYVPPVPPAPDALLQVARAVLQYAPIPLEVDADRFDNVRGYTHDGRYVGGDRGRVLRQADLVFLARHSYAEIQLLFRGLGGLLGELTAYTNRGQDGPDTFRAEFRPRSGYVKRNGVASATRLAYLEMARLIYAYTYAELLSGPPDAIWWLVRYVAPLYVSLYLAVAAA